jgi:hypothetical protein
MLLRAWPVDHGWQQCVSDPCIELKLKLKLFTTCAGKLDRLLSLGPLYFAALPFKTY